MTSSAYLTEAFVAIGLNLRVWGSRQFSPAADRFRAGHEQRRSRMALLGALCVLLMFGCNTNRLTLSWEDTSENEDGFRIYRVVNNQKTLIAEVGPNVTHYVDKSAPRDACYIVTAFNAAGESNTSNSACSDAIVSK
jgi:hypothetical protein